MNRFKFKQLHFFEIRGTFFMFVSTNLRLYQLDENDYHYLKEMYDNYSYHNIIDIKNDYLLEELIKEDIIECFNDTTQNDATSQDNTQSSEDNFNKQKAYITNITLELANDCNLNCIYCYGDGGSYGRKRELMTFDTAKKSIDFMVENSGELKELSVVFFGGEPLLNFNVIKLVTQYCREIEKSTNKKFSFSMTTNGTILNDEIYNFIKDNKISVMISMDGSKEIQDCYRCYKNGKGSYSDVIKNLKRFKEARGGHITARATVCKPNLNLLKIKNDLQDIGFSTVHLSFVDVNENSPLFVGNNKEELLNNYLSLADDLIKNIKLNQKNGDNFYQLLKRLYFKNVKIRPCNAGNNGFAIGTNGKIYPCHRFMGNENFIIGDISSGVNYEISKSFRFASIYYKEDCKDCWARYLCGGGCYHTCAQQENDIQKAPKCYCDIYKGIYEIGLYIYWNLKEWKNDIFRQIYKKEEKCI